MQRDNRHHSKEKGKGLAESLSELGLEDTPDPSVPRSGPSSLPYSQPDYRAWDQYPGFDGYTLRTSVDHNAAPTPDYGYGAYGAASPRDTRASTSRDAYGAGTAGSSTDTSPTSPYLSYGGFYGTATAGGASSYASSSASSYAPSTASTTWSSAPPRYEPATVNHHIAQMQPPQNRCELPCEFRNLMDCPVQFQGGEEQEWMDHIETHLEGNFPTKLSCWFCNTWTFDANDEISVGNKLHNFHKRMDHIRDHIVADGKRAYQMRPDGGLLRHLKREHLISNQTYNEILEKLNPPAAPPVPGGHSRRPLEQVREEPASSSRDRRRHERKERHEPSPKKRHPRK